MIDAPYSYPLIPCLLGEVYTWGLVTGEDGHGVTRTRVESTPVKVDVPGAEDMAGFPARVFAGRQFSVVAFKS